MNTKKKLLVLGIATVLSLVSATPVSAEMNVRERLTKALFDRPGAVIGKGVVKSVGADSFVVTRENKDYSITVNADTKYRRRYWGVGSFADIKVGHDVSVAGKWTDETKTTILAKVVRDLSIQKREGVFFGNVTEVTPGGFVIKPVERGIQTVTVSADTKFINRRGESISKADVLVGHRIRLRGLWDREFSTITEVKEVKDFTLPAIEVKN